MVVVVEYDDNDDARSFSTSRSFVGESRVYMDIKVNVCVLMFEILGIVVSFFKNCFFGVNFLVF